MPEDAPPALRRMIEQTRVADPTQRITAAAVVKLLASDDDDDNDDGVDENDDE